MKDAELRERLRQLEDKLEWVHREVESKVPSAPTFEAEISGSGRVVVPRGFRYSYGLDEGTEVRLALVRPVDGKGTDR